MGETVAEQVEEVLAPYLAVYGADQPTASVRLERMDGSVVLDRLGDALHHSASVIKLAVALAVRARVPLDALVEVHNGFPAAAGGRFAVDAQDDADPQLHLRLGEQVPVSDLLHRMLSVSSNLATDLLLDLVQPAEVSQVAAALGATSTTTSRHLCDPTAGATGARNQTSAADAALLVRAAYADDLLRAALAAQVYNAEIPSGLPCGVDVAHKTGWIEGVVHDVGVIAGPDRPPFVLAVLTTGFVDGPTASLLIGRIAGVCYRDISLYA